MSLPEVLLWRELSRRRLDGLHFRKQHPIGPYVLDFYCDEVKLAVEVDGESHSFGTRPIRDQFATRGSPAKAFERSASRLATC